MKNSYCDLTREQIHQLAVPNNIKGLLLSPFQFNRIDGYIGVPEDTFKDMTDVVTQYAIMVSDYVGNGNRDARIKAALYEAVLAIYLDDSSDYKSALYAVIKCLDPELAKAVEEDPAKAFNANFKIN